MITKPLISESSKADANSINLISNCSSNSKDLTMINIALLIDCLMPLKFFKHTQCHAFLSDFE